MLTRKNHQHRPNDESSFVPVLCAATARDASIYIEYKSLAQPDEFPNFSCENLKLASVPVPVPGSPIFCVVDSPVDCGPTKHDSGAGRLAEMRAQLERN